MMTWPIRLTLVMFLLAACGLPAAHVNLKKAASIDPSKTLEERWGIQLTAIRTSANGHMIDFRYKIVDSEKAAELSDPASKPYLVDQASGARLLVPRTPKIGPLRQTAVAPEVNRVYFVLFANPGKRVKPGSKVTVVLGDFKLANVTVQ